MGVHSLLAPNLVAVYNGTTSAIAKGTALKYSGTVYDVADPVPSTSVTAPVPGVVACTAYEENFEGIAYEAIAAGSWGLMCDRGRCQALVVSGSAATKGYWGLSDANGKITALSASNVAWNHVMHLETFTTLGADTLKFVLVNHKQSAMGAKSS